MKTRKSHIISGVSIIVFFLACTSAAFAGPVILGGDDLTDHGSRSGGVNIEGWLYIEKAISNLLSQVSLSGPFTTAIAALGSADPGAGTYPDGDAGGAINSVADALGKTVAFFDGDAAITSFFTGLGTGAVNPEMIWLAGTGAANDLDSSEGTALTTNASAINSFVASGGGLMSHGSGQNAYGWLTTLLPGLSNVDGCTEDGAILTAEGQTAFPGLSNSNIDSNAGPCHSHFEGNLGGLSVLALDGDDPRRNYIIGSGRGGVIQCGEPGQPACPDQTVIPEPSTIALFAIGIVGASLRHFYRKKSLPEI